jgi:hypothetical protein
MQVKKVKLNTIFLALFFMSNFSNKIIGQAFYLNITSGYTVHTFKNTQGPSLGIGFIFKPNKLLGLTGGFYNARSYNETVTTVTYSRKNRVSTRETTRGDKGIFTSINFNIPLKKGWSILPSIGMMSSNVEIISRGDLYPAYSTEFKEFFELPYPAYYAYTDYFGTAELSILKEINKRVEIFSSYKISQSPWNSRLSRFSSINLGLNLKINNTNNK